jgi:hypothetical protein
VESGDVGRLLALAKAVAGDAAAHPRLRETLLDLNRRLKELEHRSDATSRIDRAAAAITAAATPEALLLELERRSAGFTEGPIAILSWPRAMAELRRQVDVSSSANTAAQVQLESWWRSKTHLRLSHQRFRTERSSWAHLLDGPGRDRAYRALLGAVRELPLSIDSGAGAQAALDKVASQLHLDPHSESWLAATASYRDLVQAHLEDIQRSRPGWLAHDTRLTFAEALPSADEFRAHPTAALLAARPGLRMTLAAAMAREDPGAAAKVAENESIAATWRERIVAELREAALPSQERRQRTSEDALVALRQLRRRLESEALALPPAMPLRWHKPIDSALPTQLHRALDEYETVTQSIVFPYQTDPHAHRVELAIPIAVAVGVPWRSEEDPAGRLRSSLIEASRPADELVVQADREVAAAHPVARLTAGLRSALAEDRQAAVAAAIAGVAGADLMAAVERAIDEHRTAQLLRSLSEAEVSALAHSLAPVARARDSDPLTVRAAAERAVLLALSLYTATPDPGEDEAVRLLQAKIEADDYDVFLSYNARDQLDVLTIADQLRRAAIYPWVDLDQILPGRWFQDVINSIIPRVKAAAIIFGTHGLGPWQEVEIRSFVEESIHRQLPVIPVLLPGVDGIPVNLPTLRQLHRVRFKSGLDDDQALAALVSGITGQKTRLPATAREGIA